MTLGAFGMIILLSKAGFEAENIEDLKGLNNGILVINAQG